MLKNPDDACSTLSQVTLTSKDGTQRLSRAPWVMGQAGRSYRNLQAEVWVTHCCCSRVAQELLKSCSRVLESSGNTGEAAFLTGARFPAPVRAETQ